MDARQAIKISIDTGEMIAQSYLGDLTDEDLMRRPHAGCNHLNWQVGHLITAEHDLMEKALPGTMPPLPAGFAEKYAKEKATSDDAAAFVPKAELMRVHAEQLAAIYASLSKISESDLDNPSGFDFAPTVGAMYALQGCHWLMPAGQWVIVRRPMGRPVVI
jgi:hypothetical protein